MKNLLNRLGYNSDAEYQDKILYIMLLLCIVVAGFFLVTYFIYIPFLPAIITHIIYVAFCFLLYIPLKLKKYTFVKYSMLLAHIIQLTLAVYIWFPTDTGYGLYYFMVPMVSFLIMKYDHPSERYFAIISSLIATLLYLSSEILTMDWYLYQTDLSINRYLTFTTILTIALPMTYIFDRYSRDLFYTNKELKLLANTDALTHIMNRRVLYEHGVEEFNLAQKYHFNFSLLLFDIDHFKNINDQYGHPTGDELLRQLTTLISESIRKEDTFSRYGGEEFAVLLRNTSEETVNAIAKKLLIIIRDNVFHIDNHKIQITVSIGISQYSNQLKDFDHMMKAADKALYKAKNNGRNRVISA